MRVEYSPTDTPGLFAVIRPSPDHTIILIADGIPLQEAHLSGLATLTIEERDAMRIMHGYPSFDQAPGLNLRRDMGRTWHRELIPPGGLYGEGEGDGVDTETAVG